MVVTICELWFCSLPQEMGHPVFVPVQLHCDNQASLHISDFLWTNQARVDCCFVWKKYCLANLFDLCLPRWWIHQSSKNSYKGNSALKKKITAMLLSLTFVRLCDQFSNFLSTATRPTWLYLCTRQVRHVWYSCTNSRGCWRSSYCRAPWRGNFLEYFFYHGVL